MKLRLGKALVISVGACVSVLCLFCEIRNNWHIRFLSSVDIRIRDN